MNLKELQFKLEKMGVPQHMYSLKGGLPNDVYCISNKVFWWDVYYSERGKKFNLKRFLKEKEACLYFFNIIISDSSLKYYLNKA